MDQAIPDGIVMGYEARIPALILPDAHDRHVLAAAIEARAAVIMTFNLSDFPAIALQTYRIRSAHPDTFLSALLDDEAERFLQAVQRHRASLRNPPKDADAYLQTLRANGLNELALRLETVADRI